MKKIIYIYINTVYLKYKKGEIVKNTAVLNTQQLWTHFLLPLRETCK